MDLSDIKDSAEHHWQKLQFGKELGSSRNLVAALQDVGFLRHGLLRPVSEKRMPGKRKLAGHQPHHWRAIDRNIPSQVASPHCLSPFFPATSNVSERSRNAKLLDAGAHA